MKELSTADAQERAEIDQTLAETSSHASRHIEALSRCKEKDLWKSTHRSFKEYAEEHSFLKYRAILVAIEAQVVRQEVLEQNPKCNTVALTTDRGMRALKNVKPNRREYILQKAEKASFGKSITAPIIRKVSTARDYSNAYSSAPKDYPTTTPPSLPAPSSAQETTLPIISDHPSAKAFLEALYERDRLSLNQLDQRNSPKTPRQIFDHIIENLSQ